MVGDAGWCGGDACKIAAVEDEGAHIPVRFDQSAGARDRKAGHLAQLADDSGWIRLRGTRARADRGAAEIDLEEQGSELGAPFRILGDGGGEGAEFLELGRASGRERVGKYV